MRAMNAGDKAFFYHSNCKEPGIVGIMEIVKEFSEDCKITHPFSPFLLCSVPFSPHTPLPPAHMHTIKARYNNHSL